VSKQGDIKRFLCFFGAICFPVFWRRRPDASKVQGSPSDAKASPRGAFASRPADFGRAARPPQPESESPGGWGFEAGLLSSWGFKIKK
jgi:hypothetical protein